ncbi:hypothetical protein [Streptomyces sp. NPDC048496]|uniref:hypothetical protein n=1 Tax=Streptomyces sp. NPDC048496 TaxID=3365558 RepID=UPI0037170658
MTMNSNQKRLAAYLFCLLLAIIVGGVAALVVALLGAPMLAVAGAGATGFVGVMGIGSKAIGPFVFTDDKAPPVEPQREPSS